MSSVSPAEELVEAHALPERAESRVLPGVRGRQNSLVRDVEIRLLTSECQHVRRLARLLLMLADVQFLGVEQVQKMRDELREALGVVLR